MLSFVQNHPGWIGLICFLIACGVALIIMAAFTKWSNGSGPPAPAGAGGGWIPGSLKNSWGKVTGVLSRDGLGGTLLTYAAFYFWEKATEW